MGIGVVVAIIVGFVPVANAKLSGSLNLINYVKFCLLLYGGIIFLKSDIFNNFCEINRIPLELQL